MAGRLVVCSSAQGASRHRLRPGDQLLVLGGCDNGDQVPALQLIGTPQALGLREFTDMQAWLRARSAPLPLEVRTSVLGQLPHLASWASVQRQFALQLDETLREIRPQALVAGRLPTPVRHLLECYAERHGIPCEAPRAFVGPLKRALRLGRHLRRGLSAAQHRVQALRSPPSGVRRPLLLVVSLQPNSTRAFLPVAQELRELGPAAHFLLQAADERSGHLVRDGGFLLDVIEWHNRREDVTWAYRSAAGFVEEVGSAGFEELVGFMGLPDWAEPRRLGALLADTLQRNLQGSCFRTRSVGRALSELDPRAALFITNRAMLNGLLYQRKNRTRRVFFLQGIVPEIPPVSTPLDVDLAVVGSAIDLPYVRRCQIQETALRVTGYPEYDHYPTLDKRACRRAIEQLLPELGSRPLVVFTSQYATEVFPDWARRRNIHVLAETARLLPDVLFALKAHPLRERLGRELCSSFPANLVACPPFDTDRALCAADVAVTYWSTTALESILLGTPLVQLNATGLPDYFDVSGKMGRPTARTAEELARAIEELLASAEERARFAREREAFLRSHGIELDGRAAARAAREIAQVL